MSDKVIIFQWKNDRSFCKAAFADGPKLFLLIGKKTGILETMGYEESISNHLPVDKARDLWDYLVNEYDFRNVELKEENDDK